MAPIGGLSSATTSGTSSIRGYGGLASGLDRDSLIENMTAGTMSKIYKQQQAKQKLEWQQQAMRGITSKLYEFSQKYMSYTSGDNLLGAALFTPGKISAVGKYADLISVSGSSATAEAMSILGVKQMASNAQAVSKERVSSGNLSGSPVDLGMDTSRPIDMLGGSSLTITYGTKNYSVYLPEDGDYSKVGGISDALNKAMKEITVGEGKTLADVVQAGVARETDGSWRLVLNLNEEKAAGNTVKLSGDSNDLLYRLGFRGKNESLDNMTDDQLTITKDGLKAKDVVHRFETKTNAEWLAGKEISFTYNGKTEKIKLGTADELKKDGLQNSLQAGLDKAFGRGRIKVSMTEEKDESGNNTGKYALSFKTTIPDAPDGTEDLSSVLTINSADRGVLGKNGVLGIRAGSSNRLNLNNTLENSGLKSLEGKTITDEALADLTINGVKIQGLSKDDTLKEILEKINNTEGAGVRISYQANTDKFVISSTQEGASGSLKIEGQAADLLFEGKIDTNDTSVNKKYAVTKGQDAIVAVKYAGSDEVTEIVRGSNTFNLDGMNVTVKGTFGYDKVDAAGKPVNNDPVTFDATMDTEKTVKTVKEMIESFNEILELVNKELTTKPNRKFQPLTSAQEKEMSEKEIEKWNEQAKTGMLFGDSDLRSLANSMRFLVSTDSALKEIGIGVSSNYADNGKLTFDEEKFKKALEADPEKVRRAINGAAEKDSAGNIVKQGGLMVRMQDITNRYAGMTGSTKGILVERAGSEHAPTTILKNSLQKQMDAIDKRITGLQNKLAIEQDRYIKQFTSLERLISQMNSQSSWLYSAFGA